MVFSTMERLICETLHIRTSSSVSTMETADIVPDPPHQIYRAELGSNIQVVDTFMSQVLPHT